MNEARSSEVLRTENKARRINAHIESPRLTNTHNE